MTDQKLQAEGGVALGGFWTLDLSICKILGIVLQVLLGKLHSGLWRLCSDAHLVNR